MGGPIKYGGTEKIYGGTNMGGLILDGGLPNNFPDGGSPPSPIFRH